MSTTLTQWAELAAMACFGLAAGAWYDVLGFFRRSDKKLSNALLDILFWLVAAPAAALALLYANGLQVRLYAVLGAAAGFFAWRLGVSPFVAIVKRAICTATAAALRFLSKMSA